jgi:hypothetical protein
VCEDNMSKWLGFSLTPHLRIDEGFGREDQAPGFSVMPLRSDGSLCVFDPFRRPSNGAPGTACSPFLSFFLSQCMCYFLK